MRDDFPGRIRSADLALADNDRCHGQTAAAASFVMSNVSLMMLPQLLGNTTDPRLAFLQDANDLTLREPGLPATPSRAPESPAFRRPVEQGGDTVAAARRPDEQLPRYRSITRMQRQGTVPETGIDSTIRAVPHGPENTP